MVVLKEIGQKRVGPARVTVYFVSYFICLLTDLLSHCISHLKLDYLRFLIEDLFQNLAELTSNVVYFCKVGTGFPLQFNACLFPEMY